MSNPNPTPRTARYGAQLAGKVRKHILDTFEVVEKDGKPIAALLAQEFKANPLKFLDTAAKYMPKDVNLDVSHSQAATALSDDELADIIATRARARLEQAKDVTEQVQTGIHALDNEQSALNATVGQNVDSK